MIGTFRKEAGSHIAQSTEDESMSLIGAGLDDDVRWVAMPDDLGGGHSTVVDARRVSCPCGRGHVSKALVVERMHEGKRLMVSECEAKYLWTHEVERVGGTS